MKRRAVANERGVALLAVLAIVALLTIVVIEFSYSVQIDQRRARNALDALQASLLARSAVNIEESFLLRDKDLEGKFDAYTEEWWLLLNEFCQEVELGPGMRIKCGLEDESGKLNINLTRVSQESQRDVDGAVLTRDAFARDALRHILEEIDVEIVDELMEYWLQEPPEDEDGKTSRIPDFRSLEDFAAQFRIPTRYLPELRRKLTAVSKWYMSMVNANTAHPDVVRGFFGDKEYADIVDAFIEQQRSDEPFTNRGEIRTWLSSQGVSGEHLTGISRLFDVRSNVFRLRASALTKVDESEEGWGGIGQTLSVLVWRRRGRCRPGEEQPCWTLKPLDWQKEGGARLFERSQEEEDLSLEQEFDDADLDW